MRVQLNIFFITLLLLLKISVVSSIDKPDFSELAEELEHKIKEALVTPETKSSVLQD